MARHNSRSSVHTMDGTPDTDRFDFGNGHESATAIQVSDESSVGASRFLGRMVYRTCYAVSFGVTLPVMMIVRVVPRENAFVHGLVDGALAARDNVDRWVGGRTEDDHRSALDEAASDSADNGSVDHSHSAGRARRARSRTKGGTTRKATRKSSREKS